MSEEAKWVPDTEQPKPVKDKPCAAQAWFLILGAVIAVGATWLDELKDERKASREFERFQKWYVSLPHCKEEAKVNPPPGWKPKPIGAVGAAQEE